MAERISILGSTGSIGTQTLDVARNLKLKVLGLAAYRNINLLAEQIKEFKPEAVSVETEEKAEELYKLIQDKDIKIYYGLEGIKKIAVLDGADTVVTSVVGVAGLEPTIEAIENGKNIALANKETLVAAGHIVMSKAKEKNVKILPVDSEHSAIFQCLAGNDINEVSKIILTASGGPFRGRKLHELEKVTKEEALKHPNWSMGKKITIDSSTLMNKGLEVIEARWLFGTAPEQIQVVIHPQSIIHSMVEYRDGSVIAQMGVPDMRIPIQFALTYPERKCNNVPGLNFTEIGTLTFEKPDFELFPCLKLAYEALKEEGTMPVVLNAANEIAVSFFLEGKIGFMDIPRIIYKVLGIHKKIENPCLKEILEADMWARNTAIEKLSSGGLL